MYRISLILLISIVFTNIFAKTVIDKNLTWVNDIDFSADGELLACTNNQKINIYETQNWQLVSVLENIHTNTVLSIKFLPNKQQLVSCGLDSLIILWNLSNTDSSVILDRINEIATFLTVSNNNEWLAVGTANGKVFLYNLLQPQNKHILNFHSKTITGIAFSPDNQFLACSSGDKKISIWECNSWSFIRSLEYHRNWVRSITFLPSSKALVSAGDDSKVFFYENYKEKNCKAFKDNSILLGQWIISIDYQSNGDMIIAGTSRGNIYLLNPLNNYILKTKYQIARIKFRPLSYQFAVATFEKGVIIYTTTEMKAKRNRCQYLTKYY